MTTTVILGLVCAACVGLVILGLRLGWSMSRWVRDGMPPAPIPPIYVVLEAITFDDWSLMGVFRSHHAAQSAIERRWPLEQYGDIEPRIAISRWDLNKWEV